MYLFRFRAADGTAHLGVEEEQGRRVDLTQADPARFGSLSAWLSQPDPVAAVQSAFAAAPELTKNVTILAPVDDNQEVWAAGVTYERSKTARMEESREAGSSDVYDRVYSAERPELFFKSNGWRVAANGGAVRIRRDSTWNVPEPELTLVVAASGRIVGVTIGNDMSSRSIEGENPLYLPQAKIYDGACALGPRIHLLETEVILKARSISLSVDRSGETVFSGTTSTAQMRRTPRELVDYLTQELRFPTGVFLMTGTGIIPQDDFTLRPGERVSITIEGIGTLENPVEG